MYSPQSRPGTTSPRMSTNINRLSSNSTASVKEFDVTPSNVTSFSMSTPSSSNPPLPHATPHHSAPPSSLASPSSSSSSASSSRRSSSANSSKNLARCRRDGSRRRRYSSLLSTGGSTIDMLASSTSSCATSHHGIDCDTKLTRSDSGCFSDGGAALSENSSTASSTIDISRATSCAHADCVLAAPCERMIELSGIHNYSATLKSTSPESPRRPLMILDNACGSSALVTMQLMEDLPYGLMREAQIVATDLNGRAVAAATNKISNSDWAGSVFTMKMNQQLMEGLGNGDFTHVFTNFGIYLAKDVESTLKEMKRILAPGGICAFTTWKHLSWLDILRKAINSEFKNGRPTSFPFHEDAILSLTRWNPWHDEDYIRQVVQEAEFFPKAQEEREAKKDQDQEGAQTPETGALKVVTPGREDWSQYEFHTDSPRSTLTSATATAKSKSNEKITTPQAVKKSDDTSATTPSPNPDTASCKLQSDPSTSTESDNLIIEEVVSTHRYTKHEFIENFGTSVLDHLIISSWGKERFISKPEIRKEIGDALERYLMKICPNEVDEIELELTAWVVVVRKDKNAQMDSPAKM